MLTEAISMIKLMKISGQRQQNIKSSAELCSWSHIHEAGFGPITSRKHVRHVAQLCLLLLLWLLLPTILFSIWVLKLS